MKPMTKKQKEVVAELQREMLVELAVIPTVEYGKAPLVSINARKNPPEEGGGFIAAMNCYLNSETVYRIWNWDIQSGNWTSGGELSGLSYVGMGFVSTVGPFPQLRPVIPPTQPPPGPGW